VLGALRVLVGLMWQYKRKIEDIKLKGGNTTLLLPPSISILFPMTTKGKFSGSEGLACQSDHKY